MKNKFLLLTSLLVLIFSSCKNIEQNTSLSETTTVTFAADNTRSIYTKLLNLDYTYTIRGKAKSGATFQTDRHYTYNELSYTRFEIQKGNWDFTMNVFWGEELIFTGTKSVTIDKSSVISIPLYAKTGSTASLSVKLNFPENKGVAKITGALYDSVTEADAGSALPLDAGFVTYTNDNVPSGINKILKFYLYDCQDVCIASYIEGVYLAAKDNISAERTLSNVNTFAATVSLKDTNGNDLTNSGLIIKAVKNDKEYPMTAVSGTNMYTASLPAGTYDVYAGLMDTDIDLVVKFLQGGNATIIFATTTKETIISTIARLTEDSTILMAGELTVSDLTVISDAIKDSTYNVNINLSLTTGLTSISDSAFRGCTILSGIIIPDSVTSIGSSAFEGCTSLSSVTIPDSVTYIGYSAFEGCTSLSSVTIGDSVTSIYSSAFEGCTSLSSITIPDSVTSIGNSAFYGCTSLSSVTIGDSVTAIGPYAFERCTSLSSITLPDSVTTIGESAFYGCTSLSSVTIGDSVTSIEHRAFLFCTSLTAITVDSNNTTYCSIDGVLFNKDVSTLITYPAGKQSAAYTIPESVTSIGEGAFYECSSLSSVTIPESVTSIGESAFRFCKSLSSVTIPDSVTSIGSYAFRGCTALSSVTIPDSVTTISRYAFSGCTSLSSVTIPDSVTSIDNSAFSGCTSLSSVTIPDSVTTIDNSAFSGCTSLSSVTIPDSVTTISRYAFSGCTALTSLTFTDTTTWYRTNSDANWENKTGGTLTDLTNPSTNATYFKDTYKSYLWYKLDE